MRKNQIKKFLTSVILLLLVVSLIWLLPGQTVLPNNPISKKTTRLKPNFSNGGQSGRKGSKQSENKKGSGQSTKETSK